MSFLRFRRAVSPPSSSKAAEYDPSSKGVKYSKTTWETSDTFSPAGASIRPVLDLEVPLCGLVFMNAPEDARMHAQQHGGPALYDHLLHGVLQIALPPGTRSRCRSVKVGFRVIVILDMGPDRLREEDVIFERKVVIQPEADEGIILETVQKCVKWLSQSTRS